MRKVIKKFFWAWEYEKEEKWLNEMAAKGLALVDYTFCRYSFEECEPGEYSFKIQLLEHNPNHPKSEQYIRFMEETGAEQVASYLNWVYFRKKASEGPFEIFSDIESELKHNILIKKLLVPIGILNISVGILNIINCWFNMKEMVFVPFINIALAVLIFAGLSGINKKIKKLKKEHSIRE
ncbi:MAG: DUF2812 domain-containing protein [Oscillospiraceae bacterium]|nr:DUF2812 domain-containing protein [Oscillospiraceae bacterium]